MAKRFWSLVCLACLWQSAEAQPQIDYLNRRDIEFPANIESQRDQIQHLLLFVSSDKGENWNQIAKKSPQDDSKFGFSAPFDGEYWFRIACVNLQGQQDPANIFTAKSTSIVRIDTTRPILKAQAVKGAGDVAVTWSILEDHPKWDTFALEYQSKDSPGAVWQRIPAKAGLTGTTNFVPNTQGPIVIKITLADQAGNVAASSTDLGGNGGIQTALAQGPGVPTMPLAIPPTMPAFGETQPIQLPPAPPVQPTPPAYQPTAQPTPPAYQPPVAPPQYAQTLPGVPDQVPLANTVQRKLQPELTQTVYSQTPWGSTLAKTEPPVRTIASTAQTPAPVLVQQSYQAPAPPAAPQKKLPPIQFVNTPKVILEYEVSQIGASGIGVVDFYVSVDDGKTWVRLLEDESVVGKTTIGDNKRLIPLTAGDGDYWFIMNIKSKAQLRQEAESGIKPREPQPGDLPEMRVRLDTKPPVSELYAPVPDPSRSNTLLLRWKAEDDNLSESPITLEWSESREGPWQQLGINLPNSGRHAWPVPDQLPVQIFMRLRVRDLGDNESTAVTAEPLIIDLKEAKGRLKSIQSLPKVPNR